MSSLGSNWIARALAVCACASLLVACTGNASPPASLATANAGGAGSSATSARVAPDFTLESLEGATVSLSDSAGNLRLLDFWATWCAPCREEIPMLNELHETFGDQGLTILAISDEDSSVLRQFVEDHGVRYMNLVGSMDLNESYGVLGLPTAYLIDGEGHIIESFLGPKPRKILEAKIAELLAS